MFPEPLYAYQRTCEVCGAPATGEAERWSVGGERRHTHGRRIFHAWLCDEHGEQWERGQEALDALVAQATRREPIY